MTSEARPPRLASALALLVLLALVSIAAAVQTGAQPAPTTTTTAAPPTSAAPSGSTTSTTAAPNPGPVVPGAIVAAELKAGRVVVIDAAGKSTVLAKDLKNPNGVAALADGTVLIAESGGSRVLGVGGRFGLGREIVKDLDFPYGLTVGLDGTVYVTLLTKGEVGKLDLAQGKYTKLADGLKSPGDVTVRSGQLFVTETTGDGTSGLDVVMIDKDAKKTVVAKGFSHPIGIAAGAGKTLFVTDFDAGKIVKVDDTGATSDFVTKLDSPVQLAVEPYTLKDEPTFTLAVSTKTGVARFDQTGKAVGKPFALEQPTGVATVPASETPLVTPSTTTPPTTGGAAGTTSTVSTRLRPSTTRATLPLDTETPTTSSNVLALCIGVIGVLLVALIVFLIVRKPKGGAAAGFEERPLDTSTVAEAFGPCAAEEVELAEAEGGLQSVVVQREAAEKRALDAATRVTEAREALAALGAAPAAAPTGTAGPAASPPAAAPAPRARLRVEDLGLTTDAGRAALAAFARGELEAHELEARWQELGEQQAIDAVRGVGDHHSTADTGARPDEGTVDAATEEAPEDTEAAAAPETAATDDAADERAEPDERTRLTEELELAEADVEHAQREIERLQEREAQALERIAAARGALAACQAAHEARRQEAEAAQAASAAEDDREAKVQRRSASRGPASSPDPKPATDAAPTTDAASPADAPAADAPPPPPPDEPPPPPRPNFA